VGVAEISVTREGAERFHVTVREGDASTEHTVRLTSTDHERLGAGHHSPEELVRAGFEFLLEREPKESILSSFDLTVIGHYVPEFDAWIRG
jgi:hypothetical protein